MSEYDDWEHGDYALVITPENVDEFAEVIRSDNPNFPLSVFYNYAKKVYHKELLFSEFMDQLDEALQDEVNEVAMWLATEGKLEVLLTDEGDIVFADPSFMDSDLDDSESENQE